MGEHQPPPVKEGLVFRTGAMYYLFSVCRAPVGTHLQVKRGLFNIGTSHSMVGRVSVLVS